MTPTKSVDRYVALVAFGEVPGGYPRIDGWMNDLACRSCRAGAHFFLRNLSARTARNQE